MVIQRIIRTKRPFFKKRLIIRYRVLCHQGTSGTMTAYKSPQRKFLDSRFFDKVFTMVQYLHDFNIFRGLF